MFYNRGNLRTIDMSSWNTSNVTNMGDMFNYCKLIEKLDVSNFDTQNVTDMTSMFARLQNIT
jgi:surface protein